MRAPGPFSDEMCNFACESKALTAYGDYVCSARQFTTFISKTVAKRVELGQRSSVEHQGHLVHVHARASGLCTVAVCDGEYPSRVAYTLLMKVHDDFVARHADDGWRTARGELAFPELDDIIRKYQNPHEADSIMRIQKDLDETKIILHKTIDNVLERGVKLDNLVEKSTDLSAQSKMFYRVCWRLFLFCFFFVPRVSLFRLRFIWEIC